jgi:prevent-host-death family protein
MLSVTFSDLRNNAKLYFDKVEKKGEQIEVFRNGKPIAVVAPYNATQTNRWKDHKPIKISGTALSTVILSERNDL